MHGHRSIFIMLNLKPSIDGSDNLGNLYSSNIKPPWGFAIPKRRCRAARRALIQGLMVASCEESIELEKSKYLDVVLDQKYPSLTQIKGWLPKVRVHPGARMRRKRAPHIITPSAPSTKGVLSPLNGHVDGLLGAQCVLHGGHNGSHRRDV